MPSGLDHTLRREPTQGANEEQNKLEGTIVRPKDAKTPEKLPQAEDLCF
jgi:hypothetical protein